MQRKAEGEPSFRNAQDSLSKFGGKLAHYGGPLEEPLSWLEVAKGYYLPHPQLLWTSHALDLPRVGMTLGQLSVAKVTSKRLFANLPIPQDS